MYRQDHTNLNLSRTGTHKRMLAPVAEAFVVSRATAVVWPRWPFDSLTPNKRPFSPG